MTWSPEPGDRSVPDSRQPRLAVLVCGVVCGAGPLKSFFSPLMPSDNLGQLQENSFLAQ
jgi:hypothetical protein